MMRTDRAGDLRAGDIARTVAVCGWVDGRRDHGGVVFLDVRDTAGVVQVVVDPEAATGTDVHRVRGEYVVRVEGEVRRGPRARSTTTLPTGEIEVGGDDARGAERGRARRRSRSTTASTPTRCCGSGTATSTCGGRGCSATCGSGRAVERGDPRRRSTRRASSRSRRRC